jgi:hypothetical protein
LFSDLDEFFAAMFVHIIMASDMSALKDDLEDIRHEISLRQKADSSDGDDHQPTEQADHRRKNDFYSTDQHEGRYPESAV